jgi:aspartate kinase
MQDHKPWLVQKYGGTSIAKLLDVIVGSTIPESMQMYNVAVVCSARSSTTKSKGTTSMLVQAIHHATSSEVSPSQIIQLIDEIQEEHFSATRRIFSKKSLFGDKVAVMEDLQASIIYDCEHLKNLLTATWTVGEISERTQDRVLSVGEKLSCRIVVAALKFHVSSISLKSIELMPF